MIFFGLRSTEDLFHQIKPDGIVMSALLYQVNESNHRAPHGIAPVASQYHQVTGLLAHAMSLVQRDQEGALEFVRRASALAGQADGIEQNARSTRGGLAPWQIERLKRHVEKAYSGRINVDDLAQMTRLSSSYFSAAFRVSFGTSPHDYISRRRVDQAAHLMLTTDTPLCEIALDCGFADQSHLSRVFRRFKGTTPAAWRRVRRVA
ncbi:MAG: AraC family transcriptional regulator [Rhizobium sp.]|nr:AraC family transcriptional regulator [Rhizobium sp.]